MTVPTESPKPPGDESRDVASGQAAAEEAPKARRIIKRYSNRKLYDTVSSKYVTLEEIAHMIKAGEELAIIDNRTKDDLTAVTLTQIIYEEEKRKSRMPLGMLRQLITSSGDALQDFFERSVKTPVAEIRDTANRGVTEIKQSALHLREAATRGVSELTGTARRVFSRSEADIERRAEEMIQTFEASISDLHQRIEAQARAAEQGSARVAEQVVTRLEARVEDLQRMIGELRTFAKTHQSQPPPPAAEQPPEPRNE
ncbi:MAG: transcriptional regulator [Deltaproteobacteria bacterium]|nr:transcriptional regulator [Deltaproteobacteria bacterium]